MLKKQNNFKLAASENKLKYESILSRKEDSVFIHPLQKDSYGTFTDVNEYACKKYGYSKKKLLKLTPLDLAENEEKIQSDVKKFREKLIKERHVVYETIHKKNNGERFPVKIDLMIFPHNNQQMIVSVVKDLTDQKLKDQKLKESEARFRILLENLPTIAVQGYDGDGTVFFWNEANETIYGYTKREALGQKITELIIPNEMKDFVTGAIKKAGQTGEVPPSSELCLQRKDGSRIWVYSCHASVKIGDQYELYCLDHDLTSIKNAESEREEALKALTLAKEEAERANHTKNDFLAIMSHEMRTPLNPIVGFSSMLLEKCPPEQRRIFETMLRSSRRLQDLIEDILDFSRLERGQLRYKEKKVILFNLCRNTFTETKPNEALETSFTNGFGPYEEIPHKLEVKCDPNVLARLFENLLTNAYKYTKTGYVKFNIGMRYSENDQATFMFEVEDSGIGISQQNQSILFEAFTQADSSYGRSGEGVGLGLAICQKLVKLMNGQIFVKSELGKGSTFWLEIPMMITNQ